MSVLNLPLWQVGRMQAGGVVSEKAGCWAWNCPMRMTTVVPVYGCWCWSWHWPPLCPSFSSTPRRWPSVARHRSYSGRMRSTERHQFRRRSSATLFLSMKMKTLFQNQSNEKKKKIICFLSTWIIHLQNLILSFDQQEATIWRRLEFSISKNGKNPVSGRSLQPLGALLVFNCQMTWLVLHYEPARGKRRHAIRWSPAVKQSRSRFYAQHVQNKIDTPE